MASSAGQRVLDRLSLATDERLVTIVQGLLPAVLAEINGNPDPALLKTISHATTRLRGLPEARLPCDAIFSACARGGTARALGLVLLELGLPREEPAAKTALATRLVLEIASCGDVWSPQRATAVHLLLSVLPHATGDALTDAAAAHPDAAADLQDFLLDVLLATPGVSAGRVPPGLSAQRVGRLTARPATDWTLAALAPRKLAALSLLRRVSPPRDQVGALLAATCDAHYSVTDVATVALKALAESAADLNLDNDAGLTGNLLCLVLGAAKCPAGSADAARGRTAVSATFAQRAVRFAVENCKGATSGPVAMLALRVVLACAASETPALAATGASLAAFLAAHAPEAALPVLGPLLLRTAPVNPPTGPAAAPTTPAEDDKRHGGYQLIATLARRSPKLVAGAGGLARDLFRAVDTETLALRLQASETLGAVLAAVVRAPPPPAGAAAMRAVLLPALWRAVRSNDRARLAAAEWAAAPLFADTDAAAAFVCVALCGDATSSVREAAVGALVGGAARSALPSFEDATATCLSERATPGTGAPDFASLGGGAAAAAINYTLLCLRAAAAPEGGIAAYFAATRVARTRALARLVAVVDAALRQANRGAAALHQHRAAAALTALLSARPALPLVVSTFATASRVRWLFDFLASDALETRQSFAEMAPHMAPHMGAAALAEIAGELAQLLTRSTGGSVCHGAACAAGTLLQQVSEVPETGAALALALVERLRDVCGHPDDTVAAAAARALGSAGAAAPLPIPAADVGAVVATLGECVATRVGPRRAAAIDALADLARGDPADSGGWNSAALAAVCGTAKCPSDRRDDELGVVAGEAVAALAGAAGTGAAVARILADWRTDTSPHVRGASALWLLCLARACPAADDEAILAVNAALVGALGDRAVLAQEAACRGVGVCFARASPAAKARCYGAVLDALSPGKRDVNALSSASGADVYFDEEARQAAEAAAARLAAIPADCGAAAFREMAAMAREAKRPELLYFLMATVSRHACWATPRGKLHDHVVPHGLGGTDAADAANADAVADQGTEAVAARIFLRSFDTDGRTRTAMESLWGAIALPTVADAIERHLSTILPSATADLSSPDWRKRAAACDCLRHVMSTGRVEYAHVAAGFEDLWKVTFRLLDDARDVVRVNAVKMGRALASLTCRVCDARQTTTAEAEVAVRVSLPLLLSKGVRSSSPECNIVALDCLLRIVREPGSARALQPFLVELLCELIVAVSSVEPSQLAYLQHHAASMNMTSDEFEDVRLRVANVGPLAEAIGLCLDQLTEDVAETGRLVPRLMNLLRGGVGLGTRAAAVRAAAHACRVLPGAVRASAAPLLRVLASTAASERSRALRDAYLAALGSVAALTRPQLVARLAARLRERYRTAQAGDEKRKLGAAASLRAIASRAPSALGGVWHAWLLPMAFVESRYPSADTAAHWQAIFTAGAQALSLGTSPDDPTVLRSMLGPILAQLRSALTESSWLTRRAALGAASALVTSLGATLPEAHAKPLAVLLMKLTGGRTWEGKEGVFSALALVVSNCPAVLRADLTLEPLVGPDDDAAEDVDETDAEEDKAGDSKVADRMDTEADTEADTADTAPPPPPKRKADGEATGDDGDTEAESEAEDIGALDADEAAPAADAGGDETVSYREVATMLLKMCRKSHRGVRRAAVAALASIGTSVPDPLLWQAARPALLRHSGLAGEDEPDLVFRAGAIACVGALWPAEPDAQRADAKALLASLLALQVSCVWPIKIASWQCVGSLLSLSCLDQGVLGAPELAAVLAAVEGAVADRKYGRVRAAAFGAVKSFVCRPHSEATRLLVVLLREKIVALAALAEADAEPAVKVLATEISRAPMMLLL